MRGRCGTPPASTRIRPRGWCSAGFVPAERGAGPIAVRSPPVTSSALGSPAHFGQPRPRTRYGRPHGDAWRPSAPTPFPPSMRAHAPSTPPSPPLPAHAAPPSLSPPSLSPPSVFASQVQRENQPRVVTSRQLRAPHHRRGPQAYSLSPAPPPPLAPLRLPPVAAWQRVRHTPPPTHLLPLAHIMPLCVSSTWAHGTVQHCAP